MLGIDNNGPIQFRRVMQLLVTMTHAPFPLLSKSTFKSQMRKHLSVVPAVVGHVTVMYCCVYRDIHFTIVY